MKELALWFYYVLFVSLIFSFKIAAQVDPTSAGLDSGRYTVRPTTSQPIPEKSKSTKASTKVEVSPSVDTLKPSVSILKKDESNIEINTKHSDANNFEGSNKKIFEISVAPGLMYVDSSSPYWFREYHSSGPGLGLKTVIWASAVGFYLNYFTTLSADLTASPNTEKKILADHRFTDVGLSFQKTSNLSKMSPAVIFGIGYTEYQMIIPSGEQDRTRVKSAGLGLSLLAKLPQNTIRSNIFGIELMPSQNITEQKSALKVKSGSSPTAHSIKLFLGQEFTIDESSNQIFWRLSYRHEQAVYKGSANVDDPISGTKPEGVSVRSGVSLFEIGYTWGE